MCLEQDRQRTWPERPDLKAQHAFCLRWTQPLPMQALETALTVLLGYHGEKILRMKGIANLEGEAEPVVLHGVQQLLHEPVRLRQWPYNDHSTQLVFIVQGLPQSIVVDTLAHFLREAGIEAVADIS